MKSLIAVAKGSEIKRGEATVIRMADTAIVIFNAGGAFYAVQDRCTGDGGSLSEGALSGTEIRCAGDGARFYLPSGDCIGPENFPSLRAYRVRVDGNDIAIELREDPYERFHQAQFIEAHPAFQRVG